MRQMMAPPPGTQMKNIVGHCECALMTRRELRRAVTHTICAIVNWQCRLLCLVYYSLIHFISVMSAAHKLWTEIGVGGSMHKFIVET